MIGRSKKTSGLIKMNYAFVCVVLVLSIVLSSLWFAKGAGRPPTLLDRRTSYKAGGVSAFQPSFKPRQARPPTGRLDSRYGMDKRRVPTGSNPLHNRERVYNAGGQITDCTDPVIVPPRHSEIVVSDREIK
eukprot:Gb_22336 [translate_table: standard]